MGGDKVKQKITFEYDPINRELAITANDFTTFEALGILEAGKQMIANGWLNSEDEK